MTSNLGLQSSSSFQRNIFSVATSLTSNDIALPSWLTLDPKRALQNGVAVVSSTSKSLNTFTAVLVAFGSLGAGFYIYIWNNVHLRSVASWLSSRFTGSISIASTHPLNKDVLTHLEKAGVGHKTNSLALINNDTGHATAGMHHGLYVDPMSQQILPVPGGQKPVEPEPEDLEYIPIAGSYVFWHGGYRMTLGRHEEITGYYQEDGKFVRTETGSIDPSRSQTLTITCWSLGAGVQPVKDFLEYVQEVSKPSKHNMTTIYRASCQKEQQKFHWDYGVSRPARRVDSIALESGKKRLLMKECTRYFSEEDERFHASRGIPYRHGLLFYGPPGTGKTSFTVALAGHFNLNVYMINMSDGALNDRGLGKLFDSLPRRCIVLLEDIDSSGIDRQPRREVVKSSKDPTKVTKTVTVGVTLSGLLNVLDGPASVDGRLVVMTSNSPDSLDAALLRPGRIDNKVLFGYANREVSAQIFLHIFTKTPDEILSDEEEEEEEEEDEREDIPSLTSSTSTTSTTPNLPTPPAPQTLLSLSRTFATLIPPTKISPAEIQGYLMRHRDDPTSAVAGASTWAAETLAVKSQGKNVAAFDNEVKRGGAIFTGRGGAPHADQNLLSACVGEGDHWAGSGVVLSGGLEGGFGDVRFEDGLNGGEGPDLSNSESKGFADQFDGGGVGFGGGDGGLFGAGVGGPFPFRPGLPMMPNGKGDLVDVYPAAWERRVSC